MGEEGLKCEGFWDGDFCRKPAAYYLQQNAKANEEGHCTDTPACEAGCRGHYACVECAHQTRKEGQVAYIRSVSRG